MKQKSFAKDKYRIVWLMTSNDLWGAQCGVGGTIMNYDDYDYYCYCYYQRRTLNVNVVCDKNSRQPAPNCLIYKCSLLRRSNDSRSVTSMTNEHDFCKFQILHTKQWNTGTTAIECEYGLSGTWRQPDIVCDQKNQKRKKKKWEVRRKRKEKTENKHIDNDVFRNGNVLTIFCACVCVCVWRCRRKNDIF